MKKRLKRVNVYIDEKEFLLTPKQLFIKLRKLDVWSMQNFFENNSMDLFEHFIHKDRIIEEILNINEQIYFDNEEQKLNNFEYFRQEERSSSNLDQSIYPHGWYEKQDKKIIEGEK